MLTQATNSADIYQSENPFEVILQMSRSMLEDADQEEWDRITDRQEQRQLLIEQFFATPVPATDAERVASGIREMLDIDRMLIDRSKQAMNGLSTDLRKIKQGNKAKQAYAGNM